MKEKGRSFLDVVFFFFFFLFLLFSYFSSIFVSVCVEKPGDGGVSFLSFREMRYSKMGEGEEGGREWRGKREKSIQKKLIGE